MRHTLILIIFISLCLVLTHEVRQLIEKRVPPLMGIAEDEVLYLPNGKGLQLMSFGFRNALADLLWFKTINYFGKHSKSDRSYTWLKKMCELVITLDPKAKHVYEFGALMLAWEASDPIGSIAILSKGIEKFPKDWRLKYYRGFNNFFFMKDHHAAIIDLEQAATIENAPPFLASLASEIKSETLGMEAGIDFLKSMINITKDPTANAALKRKLSELIEGKNAKSSIRN